MKFTYKESVNHYASMSIKTDHGINIKCYMKGECKNISIDKLNDECFSDDPILKGLFVVIDGEALSISDVIDHANAQWEELSKQMNAEVRDWKRHCDSFNGGKI